VTGPRAVGASLQVVITCANRKTRRVPPELHADTLPEAPPEIRLATWIERLGHSAAEGVAARDLYAGEHWQVARSLEELCRTRQPQGQVWVCSAGYGLIDLDTPIQPYKATFAPGQPDTVASNDRERQAWWTGLAMWSGPAPGMARSFEQLAADDPATSLIVAASPAYLAACGRDLARARGHLASPEQLIIVSTGSRNAGPLTDHVLGTDARLQPVLGGTRQALNVRALAYLLTSHQGLFTVPALAAKVRQLLATAPPLRREVRTPSTDDDVAIFVRSRLRYLPTLSRSRLLREFRDAGRACEQSRFARIYDHVQEDIRARGN